MTRLIRDVEELREYRALHFRTRATVGLVPTMGALHAGHLSLMERSYRQSDRTIVSIYVNPLQFGADEDLDRYPRNLEADYAACESARVDAVFAPSAAVMKPSAQSTRVVVGGVSEGFEGALRPTHFEGVATIVAKLLNLVRPHRVYFGQKDFQQTAVVRRMVADLSFPLDVEVCPTVRDEDGLALSSRNAYLTPEQRQVALALPRALLGAAAAAAAGETDAAKLLAEVRRALGPDAVGEGAELEYAEVVHPDTLRPMDRLDDGPGALIAALRVGSARLLDNVSLAPPGSDG